VPFVIKLAFVSSLALLAFDVVLLALLALSPSSKIDPGVATLCGAVIGLSVIGWQARLGFQNLIKSQENQARLEREARLHQAEIEENSIRAEELRKRDYLLSALRAEIVYLWGKANDAQSGSDALRHTYLEYASRGTPPSKGPIPFPSFDAPVFRANIDNLGLLGASLGADMITVLSYADGKSKDFNSEQPIKQDLLAKLYEGNALLLKHWAQDLYHVAMRIRAIEEGTPDPGTLSATQRERRAKG